MSPRFSRRNELPTVEIYARDSAEASVSTISCSLFEFRCDEELGGGIVVLDSQNIRLAADLAIFNVALAATGGFVDRSDVPLSTRSALETRFHSFESQFELSTKDASINNLGVQP